MISSKHIVRYHNEKTPRRQKLHVDLNYNKFDENGFVKEKATSISKAKYENQYSLVIFTY